MHIVTASNRGQIVIPKEIRKKLQIAPGKRLLVKVKPTIYVSLPYRMTLWNNSAVFLKTGHRSPKLC